MTDTLLHITLWIILIGSAVFSIISLYVMKKYRWLFFAFFLSIAGLTGYGLYVQQEAAVFED